MNNELMARCERLAELMELMMKEKHRVLKQAISGSP